MLQLLPQEFTRSIELTDVVVFEIEETKIKCLIEEFNKNQLFFFPEPLSHLKRVNKISENGKIKNLCLFCLEEVTKYSLYKFGLILRNRINHRYPYQFCKLSTY